jgi:hypothetical protein
MKHDEIVKKIIDRAELFKADTVAAYGRNFGSSSFPRKAIDAVNRIVELAADLAPAKILETSEALIVLTAELERRHESRKIINRIKAFFGRRKK